MLFPADLTRVLVEPHVQAVLIYLVFMGVGTLLALIRPRLRPGPTANAVWKKYPVYILLNIAFLSAAWLPPAWHSLALLLAVIGAGACWEIARALGLTGWTRTSLVLGTVGLILAADWLSSANLLRGWLALLLLACAASALIGTRTDLGRRLIGIGGGLVYLPVCLVCMLWLSHTDSSGFYVVFLYLVVAASDAFGQFTGQIFGRRPLMPRISPAKTLEGALGALLFAALLGASLSPVMHWPFLRGGVTGLIIGLAGLIGDLSESSWKRALGIKDFSAGLGAQGGFLDRFDALIFAAPIFFLLLGL